MALCQNGHRLLQEASVYELQCNECRVRFPKNTLLWSCVPCDFDVCTGCVSSLRPSDHARTTPESKEEDAVKKELAVDQKAVMAEYFSDRIETWLPILGDLTFPTLVLPLSNQAFVALATQNATCAGADALAKLIDTEMLKAGWDEVFVKLSTRSPKDSPHILKDAAHHFKTHEVSDRTLNDQICLLADCVQQKLAVKSGQQAVQILAASKRVQQDLLLAMEDRQSRPVSIVVRLWDGALPIAYEFRGFVWDGALHAVAQYFDVAYFPELDTLQGAIAADLQSVYTRIQPELSLSLPRCIIDFVWLGPGNVRVIEINKFDMHFNLPLDPTALFCWSVPADREVIIKGPFELRVRSQPFALQDLKSRLPEGWWNVISGE